MSLRYSEGLLLEFGQFVADQMGLHFPLERTGDLERGIRSAAAEFGFVEMADCIRWLMSGPLNKRQIEVLAGHLTIGETYFLREPKAFAILEEHVLPELIESRRHGERRLRIWSAACCSGEEPFSVAISVRKVLPDVKNWKVSILGTDINPRFLQKASRAVFGPWSFRDAPPGFKERHFTMTRDGGWEILPELREMVTFQHLNLATDVYPSLLNNTNAMDIILCRNVLIYFSPEQAKRVIRNLVHCLVEGGWLVLGPNEIAQVTLPELVPARFPGAIFYRKESARWRPAEVAELHVPRWEEEPPLLSRCASETILETPRHSSCLEEAEFEPNHPSLYEEAQSLFEQGRYAETVETLAETASGETVDPRVMTLLARAWANQGNLAEALAWCDKGIGTDKLNPAVHYLRASILQELGNLEEAALAFKRALYLDQDFILAHFGLGNLARNQGKLPEAERYFENALALARKYEPEQILPEAEGLTAGRLVEIITALRETKFLT